MEWAHNAHSVPFEQSKNAHYVLSLSWVLKRYVVYEIETNNAFSYQD